MKQVTPEEVRSLFRDLKRDSEGFLNFHEMQSRIIEFREDSIRKQKVLIVN